MSINTDENNNITTKTASNSSSDIIFPFLNELLAKIESKKLADIRRNQHTVSRHEYMKTSPEAKNVLVTLNEIINDYYTIRLFKTDSVILKLCIYFCA